MLACARGALRLPALGIVVMTLATLCWSGSARAICPNFPDCGTQTADGTVPQEVTGVTPDFGPAAGGTTVDVAVNFDITDRTHPPKVYFGTKAARLVTVASARDLEATSPAHSIGRVDVIVDAPYESRFSPGGLTRPVAQDAFFYCSGACQRPTITSISPASDTASGGKQLTISGTNFTQGFFSSVRFGSTLVTHVCFVSSTEVQLIVPPSPGDQPGQVGVTVTSLTGTSAPAVTFTYTPDPAMSAHVDDNRTRFTLSSLLGLSFLPSFITDLVPLPGITGRVITQPAVHALFWDRNWDQDNPGLPQAQITAGLTRLVDTSYLADAAQYGVGSATMTGGDVSAPDFLCPGSKAAGNVNPLSLMLWITCEAGGGVIADSELPGTGGIEGVPLADGLTLANDNTDYAIFLPAHVSVGLGSVRSCDAFDAFHFFTVVAEQRIGWAAFLPYPETVYQTVPFIVAPVDCANGTSAGVADDVSHELVESATDPLFGIGWIDNSQFSFSNPRQIFQNGEVSDICENAFNGSQATLAGVMVERYWSNERNSCVPTPVPDCSTTAPRLLTRPSPALLGLKVRPLYVGALTALRHTQQYVVHGSMQAQSVGNTQPRVISSYTIVQQGPGRSSYQGATKVGDGPRTTFQIVQVGQRRCFRGSQKWVCENGMPPLDTGGILAEMFNRQFSVPATTSTRRVLTLTRLTQGNVTYTSTLTRGTGGEPMRLQSISRITGRPEAAQNLVFDYTPKPLIKLPG